MVTDSNDENITLFNSTSGVRAQTALERLSSDVSNSFQIEFSDLIEKYSGEEHIDVFGKSCGHYREVKDLFEHTLRSVEENGELDDATTNSDHVFLSLHTTYVSQWDRSIYSPVDHAALKEVLDGKINRVITFIDDVFDIYTRLMQPFEMYKGVPTAGPREALYKSIDNIRELLRWREAEISTGLDIASILNVPHYVISVKHPKWMVARIFNNDDDSLQTYYLSHHISSVKNKWDGQSPSNFQDQLNNFISRMLKNDSVVMFLPDTIDEYRMTKKDELYEPTLDSRWPLRFQENQYILPPPGSSAGPSLEGEILNTIDSPLNPGGYEPEGDERRECSGKIEMLLNEIKRQIRSRDHLLIRQSEQGIASFRPLLWGNISEGMTKEIQYNDNRKEFESGRENVVVNKKVDIGKRRIYLLFEWLEGNIDTSSDVDIPRLRKKWMQDLDRCQEFAEEEWDQEAIRDEIEGNEGLGVGDKYTFDIGEGVDVGSVDWGVETVLDAHERRNEGWNRVFDKIKGSHVLADKTFQFESRLAEVKDEVALYLSPD